MNESNERTFYNRSVSPSLISEAKNFIIVTLRRAFGIFYDDVIHSAGDLCYLTSRLLLIAHAHQRVGPVKVR